MHLPTPADLLPQMAAALTQHLSSRQISEPRFIGIRTGGVWVAQALLEALGRDDALGILDVSFYRDDFTQNGLHPQVQPSELPFEIESFRKYCLTNGFDDIGLTLRHADKIKAFEAERLLTKPWLAHSL